jgi:hypothetical protein
MIRRPPSNSDVQREARAVKQGRGSGRGADYVPWIQVRRADFASRGVSHLIPEQGRQMHALSTLERDLMLLLSHFGVREIREQIPLALDASDQIAQDASAPEDHLAPGTLAIAAQQGWKHPRLNDGNPKRMTTDALARDARGAEYPCYVKYAKDVPRAGTRDWEKLEIERAYWRARGKHLHIFTEEDVDGVLMSQLVWARDASKLAPSAAFLEFLGTCDPARPLALLMDGWPGGRIQGILQFKAALLAGCIDVPQQGCKPPPVTRPWPFRASPEGARQRRRHAFFKALRSRHG